MDIDQLPLSLDQSLIYGLVLGLGVSTLQSFQPFVLENFVPNYFYWMFFSNNSGINAFEESLNHSFNSSTSTIGTGGNFTGGGGSGGGAGGF